VIDHFLSVGLLQVLDRHGQYLRDRVGRSFPHDLSHQVVDLGLGQVLDHQGEAVLFFLFEVHQ